MVHFNYDEATAVPAIGLGTWKSKKGEVYGVVREALDMGYTHIDCAPAYENEVEVGAAIKEMTSSGHVRREDIWITSKLWNNAHLSQDVEPALKKTLHDLQLDYLDLYLIHWPVAFRPEVFFPRKGESYLSLEDAPIIDTWQAMERCVEKGLVKKIGVCNFSAKKLGRLLEESSIKPMMNQVELHPYLQQQELLQFCNDKGVMMTAYSPLGSPDRPRGMKKKGEPALLQQPLIAEIGEKHQISPAQVLLAWGLMRKTVVIPKSINKERMQQNLEATKVKLDDQDMNAIAALDQAYRYVDGSFWEVPDSGYTVADLWDE